MKIQSMSLSAISVGWTLDSSYSLMFSVSLPFFTRSAISLQHFSRPASMILTCSAWSAMYFPDSLGFSVAAAAIFDSIRILCLHFRFRTRRKNLRNWNVLKLQMEKQTNWNPPVGFSELFHLTKSRNLWMNFMNRGDCHRNWISRRKESKLIPFRRNLFYNDRDFITNEIVDQLLELPFWLLLSFWSIKMEYSWWNSDSILGLDFGDS